MPDPCPLPSMVKKRGLNEKERLLYAPMSDVGGLLYDKDAVYIEVPDWKVDNCSHKTSFSSSLLFHAREKSKQILITLRKTHAFKSMLCLSK